MMREILFRGWDKVGSKGWVYGDVVRNKKVTRDGLEDRVMVGGYEVYEDSVGEFTGACDDSGQRIFEGDIVLFTKNGTSCALKVAYIPDKMRFNISGYKGIHIIDNTYLKNE